jgi:CDP-diacylglycerol--glycerol-3-phosphate 3-phosphatidyltransferase
MNLPNQLTVARIALTVLFVISLSVPWALGNTAALVLFVLASITDYADGELARRWKMESNFGKLMDPLADKVMMAAAFICLAGDRILPPWVAVVIISREFMITGLRLLAASRGVILPAERLGKHKMAWQIVAVIFFLLLSSARELVVIVASLAPLSRNWPWHMASTVGWVLIAIALGLTVYSGVGYLWKHRGLISEL